MQTLPFKITFREYEDMRNKNERPTNYNERPKGENFKELNKSRCRVHAKGMK